MKKILRLSFVSLLMLFCGTAFAQDVTLDFTKNTWGLPEGSANKGTDEASFTNGTYTIKLMATDGYYFNSQGYLMLGKSGSSLELPAFDFAVSKIEVVGRNGASTSTKQNIFVGETAVSSETTGATETNTYDIAADAQAAGTIYTLKVLSKHNTQITAINIYKAGGVQKATADLAFSETTVNYEVGTEFTAPTFTKSTNAAVTFESDNEEVATVDAEGNIALGESEGKAVITATSEENDEYLAGSATCTIYVFHMDTYKKVTTLEPGKKYLIVAQRDDKTYHGYALPTNKNYGYMSTSVDEGLLDELSIKSTYNDAFAIDEFEDGYSIKDAYDRYLYFDGTHASFQLDAEEAYSWTITPNEDGTFDIVQGDYFIQFGDGTYTTFGGATTLAENAVKPMLYKFYDPTDGIENVKSDVKLNNNVRYNIAGQRVNDSYKGIVVMNGKKFMVK